jgi:hypothetical protein
MNVAEISRIIEEHIPSNGDAFQDAWLHLLETDRDDMHQLHRSIRKAKNRQISEYFRKKKETSQFGEEGNNILDRYIVPAELDINDDESVVTVKTDFYKQIAVYFLKEFLLEREKNRELRERHLNIKAEMLVEKWEKRKLRKELTYKRLENSRRWRELCQERLEKKSEMFQKKYELRKRRLDLEAHKLEKKRRMTRLKEDAIQNRLAKIERSIRLQKKIISNVLKHTGVYRHCHIKS